MFRQKALILLTACLSWSHGKLDRYCAVCEDHTMCKFQGLGKDCVNPGGSGVSEAERTEILDVHNWVRRVVASGYETRGSGGVQPKAANMRKLLWDEELAKVAQRWADQCRFEHDTCRNDPRWKVGQNIYWKYKYPRHHVNWTEVIMSWYSEVSLFNPEEVSSYRFEPETGHYTQLLWHDTHLIGCGRRDYGHNKLYVCNYGPTGNWLGEPLYAVGEPCSKCPKGTVCEEYLCAPPKPEERVEHPPEAELTLKALDECDLETLQPPRENPENSENVRAPEGVEATPCGTRNQTRDNQMGDKQDQNVLNYVFHPHKDTATTNSIDNFETELDEDIMVAIDQIKFDIEGLVKKVIKKFRKDK